MPGKRPRAGQIRRTTSMSLFTPAAAVAAPPSPSPPALALFTPSARICPISDIHMTHIQEPLGIVDQTSTISGGRDPYISPPISNNHINPSMPSSNKPNSKEPEPVPMPTLLISSAKLSFRNYEHHHHHDCNRSMSHDHFLDVCFLCRKRIGHGRDIFIYRGDSAFCSAECRHRQIVADEKIEKCRSVIGVSATGPVATSDPNETAMAA